MNMLRSNGRGPCIFMAVLMLLVSMPSQSVFAALIDTQTAMDSAAGDEARSQLNRLLVRADIQAALIAHGIDPAEAKKRIAALSDEEAIRIADQIDTLPAGGNGVEFLLVAILVLVLVFIILDLTGVTDVFTFIKKK